MTYQEKLKDPRWQKRRLEVLNAAFWRCEDCKSSDKELQVHHCYYYGKLQPWEYGSELLMCLCSDCHKERQSREEAIHVEIGKILRQTRIEFLESLAWEVISKSIEQATPKARFQSSSLF